MLKLPKGLKKKKKGKKSKRKGEEELFTEEELEKYRREHHSTNEEESVKENEEWSKFKDLTTGIDSVLRKTQGDLDRIKSTSFFQRVTTGPKELKHTPEEVQNRGVIEVTAADFPQLNQCLVQDKASAAGSDCALTDDDSEQDDQDDIFDTSYVEAVERGEVKLAYVPDSPEQYPDDDIFDTSHVDALIKGQPSKGSKGKKTLDIGVAVEVLTGRIDNVTVTTKRPKRVIPGDLLLENTDKQVLAATLTSVTEPHEKSILDLDAEIPLTAPIDLSVSLHTSLLLQNNKKVLKGSSNVTIGEDDNDEFTLLATESLELSTELTRLSQAEIKSKPIVQESWSAFEADKSQNVFAECIVEDQIDIADPYQDLHDPFDTSFAEAVIPSSSVGLKEARKEPVFLEDDDDFDPRADEIPVRLNNRRKSSVRIHLTDPSGVRESITSDDIQTDKEEKEAPSDLLGGSTTDLTQLGDSLLNPVDACGCEFDPFDTTIADKIVAPGKVELKFLEQELIGEEPPSIFRVPSDPDFDPRADETKPTERRASRPENLTVNKTVVFDLVADKSLDNEVKPKAVVKPLTPYYTRELSITENIKEELETTDVLEPLARSQSDEDLTSKINYPTKRRHSEHPQSSYSYVDVDCKTNDLRQSEQSKIVVKVLTPLVSTSIDHNLESDPFDTSYANIAPTKTELKLLTKEFSCEDSTAPEEKSTYDFLEASDDIFHVKALSPEPSDSAVIKVETIDPFDTSFASDLNPGKTELKFLESELLN